MASSKAEREVLTPEGGGSYGLSLPDPLVGLCIVLAVIGAASAAVPLTIVSVLVLVVVVFARGWARLSLERVSIQRSFSRNRVFAGDDLEVDLVVENRKPLPLPWLRLSFLLPEGLVGGGRHGPVDAFEGGISFSETFSLARYERVRAVRTVVARRRGCYRLGPAHLESGDLFGFYSSRANTTTLSPELVVFPNPRPLPGFELAPRIPDGEARGTAKLHEDYSRPSGAREYQPGDPLKLMDWKGTARRGQPLVRTFDPSNGHRVIVLLEAGTSDQPWRFRPEQLEAAVSAAASVAVQGIERGFQVGLVTNGLPLGTGRPLLRPAGGGHQLEVIMHSLARVQPMPTSPLGGLYEEHARPQFGPPHGLTVVYVTARWKEDMTEVLARQAREGALVCGVYVGEEPIEAGTIPIYDASAELAAQPADPRARDSVIYA